MYSRTDFKLAFNYKHINHYNKDISVDFDAYTVVFHVYRAFVYNAHPLLTRKMSGKT